MSGDVRVGSWRLAAMMALVYAVQGSFWPLLAVHLGDLGCGGRERGWIFGTLAMGSAIVPLGAGRLVDRLMPTQRFLALAHAMGTVLLAVLASGLVVHPGSLFLVFLAYWMILAPSYALCGSLAMRHLDDPRRQFGGIRLWGTIGWMVAGWLVSLVMAGTARNRTGQGAHEAFLVATFLCLAFAAYALTLPHTPPLRAWWLGHRPPRGAAGAEAAGRPGPSHDLIRRFADDPHGLSGHARVP